MTSAFRCAGCRRSIWAAFASSLTPTKTPTSRRVYGHALQREQVRRLHQSRPLRSDERHAQDEAARIIETQDALEAAASEQSQGIRGSSSNAVVPWYLQEQPSLPEREVNPFAERQRIPALPESPPAILQPLLNQISIDLGMDYLSILDLRRLYDPPPAFGVNLLMIVGTARSEKHLNVSADRLCRWLRSNYKLAPRADGLLGRNELKLKMRRKAKRSRIMTAAGGSGQIPDDGTSTGWICVNLGTVEGGLLPGAEQDPSTAPGFVGFSTSIRGAKIVVQLMTEEKRADVDLESLWQGMLDRQMRREAGADKAFGREDAASSMESSLPSPSLFASPRRPRRASFAGEASPLQRQQQARWLHTTSRTLQPALEQEPRLDSQPPIQPFRDEDEPSALQNWSSLRTDKGPSSLISDLSDSKKHPLVTHWTYLTSLTASQALAALGNSHNDRTKTAFLRFYNTSLPTFRSDVDFRFGIMFHAHAIDLGHPGYTRQRLLYLLREAQASSVHLPRSLLLRCLRTIVQAHNVYQTEDNRLITPRKESRAIVRRVFAYAKEIFEIMELYSHSLRQADIYYALHDAVMNPVFSHPNANLVPDRLQKHMRTTHSATELQHAYHHHRIDDEHHFVPRNELAHSVFNAVTTLYEPEMRFRPGNPRAYDTSLYKHMMRSYLVVGDYADFWAMWRMLPKMMRRRDAEMYVIMLEGQAAGGSMKHMADAVREAWFEMPREEPVVGFWDGGGKIGERKGGVARSMSRCLRAAGLERLGSGSPYEEIWREVDSVLGLDEEEEDPELEDGRVHMGSKSDDHGMVQKQDLKLAFEGGRSNGSFKI